MNDYRCLILVMIVHVVGYFYAIPKIFCKKELGMFSSSWKRLLICLLVSLLMWMFFKFNMVLLTILTCSVVATFLVDLAAVLVLKLIDRRIDDKKTNNEKRFLNDPFLDPVLFITTQFIYVFIFALFVFVFGRYSIETINNYLGIDFKAFSVLLSGLLIWKPANAIFKICFRKYNPDVGTDKKTTITTKKTTILNAGQIIGNLERTLMLIICLVGSISSIVIAIPIILTVKTIARFEYFKEKANSDYYIIGTLYSVVFVTLTFLLVLHAVPYIYSGEALASFGNAIA